MDVAAWLRGLGLEQYAPAFRDNDVDGEVLPELTADDLIGLGVTSIGHRRKLLAAIAALGAEPATTVVPSPPSATSTPVSPLTTAAERRQLTVMFCDLVGSTALSTRHDPEDLRELIGDYHRAVAETVGHFAGFVAKYMGDGVLVYFGYPQAHEDDAERAVRAGLAVIEAVGRLPAREDLRVRIGIATGLAVVGDLIGEGVAQERGVVGETPNLAARLQALAMPNALVIAEATRRQIGGLFDLDDLGPQVLAGFAQSQPAWRVIGESGILSRFEALRSEAAPMIGRNEELDLLIRRWQQAKAGEGRVVLISGEPGIGKSRLTAALSEHIGTEPHTRLRYFCSPHHQDSALHPFIAQLERAAGFTRDELVEEKLGKLRASLAPGAREDDDIALLSELLSLPSPAADLNLSPQRKREKLFDALLSQLEAEATHRPVLMVFEDAHWIDPTSRELLDLIVDRMQHLSVLLAITFRPEFRLSWSGNAHVTTLALNRLGERDGEALVQKLAGNAALTADVVAEIVERTDGVPLFVEELTKAVLESAEPGDRVAAVLATTSRAALSVPATLHASLMARLDRLGSAPKEIAQIGAVLGREFAYELIEPVAQRDEKELQAALGRLSDAGLLFCRGTVPHASYLFKHALVQDAAYDTLLRARRQELHARVAAILEQHFPDLVDSQPELLAHHFTRAGLVDPAIEFWSRAGARSIARSAHSEAVSHFESALDLVNKLAPSQQRHERELELTLALAVPLIAVHGFGSLRVENCALRAKGLSDELPSSRRFAAQRVAWNSCLMRQPVPRTVVLARELVELAEGDDNLAKLAVAHRALGYSLFIAGEFREAIELLDRGVALADALSDQEFAVYGEHPGMVCRIYAGQTKILMGLPETGARLIEAAIEHARCEGNTHSLAWALAVAAHSFVTQHETQATVRFASEAIDTAREHRLPQWLALGERCKGWAIHQLGDFAAGMDLEHKGVRRWYETGAALHTTHCEVFLAESLLREGQTVAARAHLDRARAHSASYGEEYLAAEIERLEALLLQSELAPGEVVEKYLAKAIATARRQEARLFELRAAASLARLCGKQGRRAEARNLLAPVYGWFTEGFDTADLKEARSLLEQLA